MGSFLWIAKILVSYLGIRLPSTQPRMEMFKFDFSSTGREATQAYFPRLLIYPLFRSSIGFFRSQWRIPDLSLPGLYRMIEPSWKGLLCLEKFSLTLP